MQKGYPVAVEVKVVHMMKGFEYEKTANEDGRREQVLLVVRQYFAMHEMALENLKMRDV